MSPRVRQSAAGVVPIFLACLIALCACGRKGDPRLAVQVLPEAPRRLQAVARPEAIILFWQAPRKNTDDSELLDLGGFSVFREALPAEDFCRGCPRGYRKVFDLTYRGPQGRPPGSERFFYFDRDPEPGHVYVYTVRSRSAAGRLGSAAGPVEIAMDVPPPAPGTVRVERSGWVLRLFWEVPAGADVTGFSVYRSEAPGDEERFPLTREPVAGPPFEDVPEKIDRTYYYRVRSVRSGDGTILESAASPVVRVDYGDTTPPGVPQMLTAIATPAGVLLKWMPKTEKDFAGFRIYRRESGGKDFVLLNKDLFTGNSWVDTSARLRRRYTYAVTAVDASARANESPHCEPVDIYYILR